MASPGIEDTIFKNLRNIGLEFGAVSDPKDTGSSELEEPELRSSAHSVDLSVTSEDTMFDTQNMLSLFVKKSNQSDCDPDMSVNTNANWMEENISNFDNEDFDLSGSFLKTANSIRHCQRADFKDLNWCFPSLGERRNKELTYFQHEEMFKIEDVKISTRNGVNCIEMMGRDDLIFGDMDGNVSLKKLNSNNIKTKLLFSKILIFFQNSLFFEFFKIFDFLLKI